MEVREPRDPNHRNAEARRGLGSLRMVPEGTGDPTPHREAIKPPTERIEELEGEVEQLESRVDELTSTVDDLENQLEARTQTLAKVQADYENYRKRAKREAEEARREARAELVDILAGVLDDVERALGAGPSDTVRKGLQLITERIEDRLDEMDVERIAPETGDRFDPNLHEPLAAVPANEHEPETVVEVLQPGYRYDGKLVRAARVKVARAASD